MPRLPRGNKQYYYRSVRVDGRPRTVYVGGGIVGATAAAADQLRQTQRKEIREKRLRIAANTASVVELNEQLDSLVRATLVAAGFYQHARCHWRRRHHVKRR